MSYTVQTQIYPSDDTCIIVEGTQRVQQFTGEFWGFEFAEIETETDWHRAYNEETGEEVVLSQWLEWLTEFEDVEII